MTPTPEPDRYMILVEDEACDWLLDHTFPNAVSARVYAQVNFAGIPVMILPVQRIPSKRPVRS